MSRLPVLSDTPFLTIGMAHYEDFHGVYFTIQALRLAHPSYMPFIEFVVIDNSPKSPHSAMVKGLLDNMRHRVAGVKYIQMTDPVGTSPSRNRIIEEATGQYVLVMDCHVLLTPEALPALFDYYLNNPGTTDLLSGPMLMDDHASCATHFDSRWREEMWGTWGTAWGCKCKSHEPRATFALTELEKVTHGLALTEGSPLINQCGVCGEQFPSVPWSGHEKVFEGLGYVRLGLQASGPAFDIPGQGLGLFSTRRDSWLGFNKDSRGFGGEELYIHGKYRAAGHRCLCIPELKWNHRFGRPEGVKYPITRWNKVRNYVLEFLEMGWELTPIHEHFIKSNLMSQLNWEKLLNEVDPTKATPPPAPPAVRVYNTVDDLFSHVSSIPRDLDYHMPKLRELASKCVHVTEFSSRRESTIALLAGRPKQCLSYNGEVDDAVRIAVRLVGDTTALLQENKTSDDFAAIQETDMLFLDTKHTRTQLKSELSKFAMSVRRFIVIHDTHLFAFKGEDGDIGLLPTLSEFMNAHREWSVLHHTTQQYGLTVLGCLPEDKPRLPSVFTMAANFTKAAASYVFDNHGKATEDLYKDRLMACTLCDQRKDSQCTACGCFIEAKAMLAGQTCPLNRWPLVELKVPKKGTPNEDA